MTAGPPRKALGWVPPFPVVGQVFKGQGGWGREGMAE